MANNVKHTDAVKDLEQSSPHSFWTSASYAVVMVLIGLPLWWKTTAVHRVQLPYDDMLSLHDFFRNNLQIGLRVDLKGFAATGIDIQDQRSETIRLKYNLSKVTEREMEVLYKSRDLYEIDSKLCFSSSADLTIYYVGREDFLREFGQKTVLGNCRSLYYISNSAQIDMTRVDRVLRQFLNKNPVADHQELPLSAAYDILLSLLVPQPEVLDADWEVEQGVKDYLQPLLGKLSTFAEFKVRSQVLYYVKLNLRPKQNGKSGAHTVPADQLPLVINPVETKLTSFVSPNPAVNFVTYVPPCFQHPLQILNQDGTNLDSNAFFVPQWGGILIYNGPCPNPDEQTKATVIHAVSMTKVMSVILSQFRDLIGVPRLEAETIVLDFRGSALRDWEVDLLLRHRLQRLLFTSANTLMSLGNLLDQITNIVVTEEVGGEVERSVEALKTAYAEASVGNLESAQKAALVAYKSSEIAFHHPTNLAQLYFPDDQKYAIYIPLFLPVGIPVILSLLSFLKGRKKV